MSFNGMKTSHVISTASIVETSDAFQLRRWPLRRRLTNLETRRR